MLEVNNLRLRIDGKTILSNINLSLQAGSLMALLGPSGSGKSSLIRSLIGLAQPDSGEISMDKVVCQNGSQSLKEPSQRGMAYLFQDFTLVPHLNVKANITLGLERPKEHKAKLSDVCDMLGIGDLLKREIDGLSGGEQQRVALARTLMLSPKLILLDEPFSNLDRLTKESLLSDIKTLLRQTNTAAILATHDQREAFFFSDEMLVLKDGEIAAHGPSQTIYQQPPNEWVARFTGDINIIHGSTLNELFPGQVGDASDTGRLYLVRPEHIALSAHDAPAGTSGTITETEFYGFYHRIRVSCQAGGGTTLNVLCTHGNFAVGDSVTLSLIKLPVQLS